MSEEPPLTTEPFDPTSDLLERGERFMPGEFNGVEVIRLGEHEPHTPVPGAEVFPLSYENRGVPMRVTNELRVEDFCDRVLGGGIDVEMLGNNRKSYTGQTTFPIVRQVDRQGYLQAVADGRCPRRVLDDDEQVLHNARTAVLADLVTNELSLADSIKASRKTLDPFIDDLEGIEGANGARVGVEGLAVREVFELFEGKDGPRSVRLVNFSDTQITDEQLAQAANVLRAAADRTGGGVYETLYTIAILPEDHPSMLRAKKMDDGSIKNVPLNAY